MEFSDGLAAAAIALSLSTIFFGVLFYHWQTEQGARVAQTISDFAKEMHAVLGEIKGLTTSTREQQQDQFKQLLEFALGQQRASIGEELEERVAGIEERVTGLTGGPSPEAKEQMDSLMAEVKREVESLANDIKLLGQSGTSRLSSAGGRATDTPFLDSVFGGLDPEAWVRVLPTAAREDAFLVAIEPLVVEPGGSVSMRQVVRPFTGVTKGDCEVRTRDGRSLSAPWLSPSITLVFPNDFPYASTELPGEYSVTVRRQDLFSPTATPREAVFRGAFRVCSPEAADD